MTETIHHRPPEGLAPLAALATWGALWRAGRCAPDDVVDALVDAGGSHRVTATDPAAVDVVGTGAAESGTGGLLRALRSAESIRLVLPAPGDTCGLTGDLLAHALDAGQALVLESAGTAIALFARSVAPGTVVWTARSVPPGSARSHTSMGWGPAGLGDVERDLRDAVRETAELFTTLGSQAGGRRDGGDIRLRLAALSEAERVDVPPAAGDRVRRVLDQSAQIAAIIGLVAERAPASGVSGSGQYGADAALRRLGDLVRVARMTALNTMIADIDRVPRG